jgi:hypothetical protein
MELAERTEEDRWQKSISACGMAEKDIRAVGVTLAAAKGYYVLNMRDIASVCIHDPDGEKFHQGDWGFNDGKTKQKTESNGSHAGFTSDISKAALRNSASCPWAPPLALW